MTEKGRCKRVRGISDGGGRKDECWGHYLQVIPVVCGKRKNSDEK